MSKWEVEGTDEFQAWFLGLNASQSRVVMGRVDLLAAEGPNLKRPAVGEVKGSKHDPHMKELRCGSIRVLFAFDPERTAILLLGGDKRGSWSQWYREASPPPTPSTTST
jgi:hypothetical protein